MTCYSTGGFGMELLSLLIGLAAGYWITKIAVRNVLRERDLEAWARDRDRRPAREERPTTSHLPDMRAD